MMNLLHNEMFAAYTGYAQGQFAELPVFGPAGGSNFISTQSLSEAILGALQRGEAGKAYLAGDENLSFADYFAAFFRAAGNPQAVAALDQEHPLLPDIAIYYTRRGDVQRAVDEGVAHCRAQQANGAGVARMQKRPAAGDGCRRRDVRATPSMRTVRRRCAARSSSSCRSFRPAGAASAYRTAPHAASVPRAIRLRSSTSRRRTARA